MSSNKWVFLIAFFIKKFSSSSVRWGYLSRTIASSTCMMLLGKFLRLLDFALLRLKKIDLGGRFFILCAMDRANEH